MDISGRGARGDGVGRTSAPGLPYKWVPEVWGNNPRGLPEMSRIKNASRFFALLACLIFLLAPLVGCQLSSPVAPNAAVESSDGISGSLPGDGPSASDFAGVGG